MSPSVLHSAQARQGFSPISRSKFIEIFVEVGRNLCYTIYGSLCLPGEVKNPGRCADTSMRSIDSGEREVSRMATSSITKNFVISGKEQVEAFADAMRSVGVIF